MTPTQGKMVCDARRHWNPAIRLFQRDVLDVGAPFNNYSPPATGLQAGTLSFHFSDSSNGTLSYVLTPDRAERCHTRQPFGRRYADALRLQRFCGGRDFAGRMGPDVNQHYDTLVAIWYTYGSTASGFLLILTNLD